MTDDERLGPPPVEPMSDAAWSRVERGLWSRMDAMAPAPAGGDARPPARRWWLAALPIAAAAAIALVVLATRTPPAPPPSDVAVADEPARVVSGSAPSSVSFGDAHLELAADTAVVMSHDHASPTVLVERGEAWFTVAPRAQRPAFVVRAGDATVRVVGTRFRVARSDERIAVEVERGLVDVQFHGAMVSVGPGRRWSSETPAQTSTLAGTPPPVPVASGEPAAPATEPTEPPPVVAGAERPVTAAPSPAPVVTHPPVTATRPPPAAPPRSAPAIDDPPAPRPAAVPADRDRAEYDRLAALEAASPDAALTGYLGLARGTSRWADPALFAAARLAVDRHDRRAETLLGIYLQRFPGGANATDARQLLARLKRTDRTNRIDRVDGETP